MGFFLFAYKQCLNTKKYFQLIGKLYNATKVEI